MRIAVAGSGAIARYISDEFPKYGHEVVILTRSWKEVFANRAHIKQVVTDYSVASLTAAIGNCKVLISVILSYSADFIDVHRNLIQACLASPQCKRFIPSEYGGDLENYPDIPLFYYHTREPIRKAFREQTELQWTLVSVGWLADYVVPSKNRYLVDIGESYPVNLADKQVIIPGTGQDPVDLTAARDLATALAYLVKAATWEPYTYISGVKTCWNELAELVQQHYPDTNIKHLGLGQILDTIQKSEDEDEILAAQYQMFAPLRAGSLDPVKVEEHRRKYFPGVNFRSPKELIIAAKCDGSVIV